MAALMRSVSAVGGSFLGRLWHGGVVETRRSVRALRRRPVKVIYPGEPPSSGKNQGGHDSPRGPGIPASAPVKREHGNPRASVASAERRRDTASGDPTPAEGRWSHSSPRGSLSPHSSAGRKQEHGHSRKSGPPNSSGGRPDRRAPIGLGVTTSAGKRQEHGGPGGSAPQDSPGTSRQQEATLDGLRYEKAFPDDKRLGKVVTIAKSKKFRDQHGKILLEGRRLITDALDAGAVLQTLFFSTVDHLKELPMAKLKGTQLIKVKFGDIKSWSDLVTPQGLIGIFARPDHAKMSYPASQLECSLPLTLICDNIRDPGNLGTILRSAAGAGCRKVLLTKGCVDAWEPKVLRAGMGAHFRMPVITCLEWDVLPNYLPAGTRVYVADNCSMNTAQGTLGKYADDHDSTAHKGKASDYGWVSMHPKRKGAHQDDYSSSDDEIDESEDEESVDNVSLPELDVQSYDEHWACDPAAIIIGGETQGLSLESLQLAETMGGAILLIPIVPGVESLNSAMAASILLFEGKRQLQFKDKQEGKSKRFSV